MASVQYCLGSCLGQKRNFKALSIVQPGNTRHSINLVTKQPNYKATFSQLSIDGENQPNLYDNKRKEKQWRVYCSNDGSCGIAPQWSTPSVLDLVQDFYSAINVKDTQKLDQLLSHDCLFQDLIFYIPFSGKQSIINFVQELMDAMGQNVHFVIDSWMEGENLTASVDGKLIISKITGVEELPVKPGDLVLKLLKAVSSVFDSFPFAAEQLLTKSQGTHEGIIKLLEMLGAFKKN
ncbi:uncharacterized protein LOC111310731 [Durio zibethinus]|uniref:Uncharacterized protein LOC111310731 n=1 Tax=Durio zibethinus TaxID=66656 RepID=A0A6P6AM01_DURZI|nr:uncharacterized protein LOC111310731 [Durio zibethinus]